MCEESPDRKGYFIQQPSKFAGASCIKYFLITKEVWWLMNGMNVPRNSRQVWESFLVQSNSIPKHKIGGWVLEIQLETDRRKPAVAICPGGNIRLFMPPSWKVEDALAVCRIDILILLEERFVALFDDRTFPRSYNSDEGRLLISPKMQELPDPNHYFEFFLKSWIPSARSTSCGEASRPSHSKGTTSMEGRVSKLKYR